MRGLRTPVSLVLKHLAAGKTAKEIADEFPELELEDIGERVRYAAWLASGRGLRLASSPRTVSPSRLHLFRLLLFYSRFLHRR